MKSSNKIKALITAAAIMALTMSASAQTAGVKRTNVPKGAGSVHVGIQATYFVKNNQIKIRWAPVNDVSWRMCMKYGFIIERRTVVRNNEMVTGAAQIKSFVSYPAIKDSLPYWERYAAINDYAAVMAQALYGEKFEVDINNAGKKVSPSNTGATLLGKAEENKQRYLFGMYAADNDFNVAQMAGLGFLDTATKANEKYFYRIFCAGPRSLIKSDTALLFISPVEIGELPQAAEITAAPSSHSVVLSWDMERTKSYYNGFLIERSSDGGTTYQPLNDRPYSSLEQNSNPDMPNSVVYTDTAVQTNITYTYRVAGMSIFGERGPWSKSTTCKSLALLAGVPGITGLDVSLSGATSVRWFFEDSIRNQLSGFEVQHARSEEGPYNLLLKDIPPQSSMAELPDSMAAGYLIVKAVSKEGISRTSFPYLYQPEDSTAPSVPKGITGVADSNGHVVLKWLPNPEKDLLGYKVFRTMNKGQEYAVLVDTVWYGTTFYDTLDTRLINNKIYYSVTALDYRFNQSPLAKGVEVIKPDLIPPTAPVFADYKIGDGKVDLEWVNSSDEDVAIFYLFRKAADASAWDTIWQTKKKDITKYTDDKVNPEKKYYYRIAVADESGHISPETKTLTVMTLPKLAGKVISGLESDVDRDKRLVYLHWKLTEGVKVNSIEIFRGDEKEPMSLYKVIDGKVNELLDNDLMVNTRYKYGIRAMLSTGQYTELVLKEVNY